MTIQIPTNNPETARRKAVRQLTPYSWCPRIRRVNDKGESMCACTRVCVCVLTHMRCGHVTCVGMAHVWRGHRCLWLVCVFSVFVCGPCALCVADRAYPWHMSTCMCGCADVCTLHVQSGCGMWGGLCDVCVHVYVVVCVDCVWGEDTCGVWAWTPTIGVALGFAQHVDDCADANTLRRGCEGENSKFNSRRFFLF